MKAIQSLLDLSENSFASMQGVPGFDDSGAAGQFGHNPGARRGIQACHGTNFVEQQRNGRTGIISSSGLLETAQSPIPTTLRVLMPLCVSISSQLGQSSTILPASQQENLQGENRVFAMQKQSYLRSPRRIGQWSDPIISLKIAASATRFLLFSSTQK